MKSSGKISLIIGGLLLGLAAFPVFAQEAAAAPAVTINRVPLTVFRDHVKAELAKKEVDLNAPFSVEMEGYLTIDGTLDLSRTKFVRMEGNEQILKVVQNGIAAVSNSGYFKFLSEISDKTVHLSMVQDDANFSLAIQTVSDSPKRAKTLETLFKLYVSMASKKKQRPEATQNEKDDLALLRGTSVVSEEKKLIIKVFIPKSVIHEIIQRKLIASEPVPGMPNGIAENLRVL